MAQTTPPDISPVPTPAIQRGDRATFSSRVDAFILWLVTAVAQFRAVALNVYNNAVDAFNSATTAVAAAGVASAQANAAQAVIGVQSWASGTTYAKDTTAISQVNSQTYRRVVAGAGTVDPANDQVNWRLLSGNDSNGAFVPVPVPALEIDLALGNYFTKTISANSAFTFKNIPPGGSSFSMELTTTTAALIVVFPSSVRTPENTSAPFKANKTQQLMFVTSNGGARVRLTTAANFDT